MVVFKILVLDQVHMLMMIGSVSQSGKSPRLRSLSVVQVIVRALLLGLDSVILDCVGEIE